MQFTTPLCAICKHRQTDPDAMTCDAFPEGIPFEILSSSADHRKAYSGDRGIMYEKKKSVPDATERSVIRLAFGG